MQDQVLQPSQSAPAYIDNVMMHAAAVRIWLDRKITIPRASNACSGFDDEVGWTFFDLTALHDEFAQSDTTVLEADFYHAAKLLPMSDEDIVAKVWLSRCTC